MTSDVDREVRELLDEHRKIRDLPSMWLNGDFTPEERAELRAALESGGHGEGRVLAFEKPVVVDMTGLDDLRRRVEALERWREGDE
jgi:hypothetical protein